MFHIFAAEMFLCCYMPEKKYKMPALCWLRVTDYIKGWLRYELGGVIRVNGQYVVSVQHLEGARAILRMETVNDTMEPSMSGNAMSATRYNCVAAGMELNPKVVEQMYGITPETLPLFIPIECPRLTLTPNGVLRPWNDDTCFEAKQAAALHRLLRDAFWQAVTEFSEEYAKEHAGQKYAQEDMVEAFCKETSTDARHVAAIRREWQRRRKRG